MKISSTSKPIVKCQICNSDKLKSILFVGYIPPVNSMEVFGTVPVENKAYPLELVRCESCSLVQIGLDVAPEILFPPSYPYLSASTKILRENFANLCEETTRILGLKEGDLVVDFGSNDGTLLSNFKSSGYRVLGVEPSQAGEIANSNGIETLISFFGEQTAKKVKQSHGKAQLITAANVFAHISDVHQVLRGIAELLGNGGVFVSENHYLLDLVATLQYDTIYHEHLRYYSVTALTGLFEAHDMEIFRVSRIPTHGGSIRVYACRKGERDVEKSVSDFLEEEKVFGLKDGSALEKFKRDVLQSKLDLMALLAEIKRQGHSVYGIGAPSRASTLINYVGLDEGVMDCVLEISSSKKLDKYIPGTRIPVLDEAKLFSDQPEYALLLSWHISDELITNLRNKGYRGQFIAPLPAARILD